MGFIDNIQKNTEKMWRQGTVPPEVEECDRMIAELENKSDALITQIGQLYIKNNTVETSEGSPYEESMKALRTCAEQKEGLFKRKLALQGLRMCGNCGNVLSLDSAFCNKCGEKLDPVQDIAGNSNISMRHCPKCGALVDDDSEFCVKCGQRL